jgi:hypothetical protein
VGVLQHAVGLAPLGGLARLPVRCPVHDGGLREIESGIDLVLDLRGRGRGDELDPGPEQGTHVGVGHQLGVGDQQEVAFTGHGPQILHRADDLADLGRATAEDPGMERDAAVGRHRESGLDLLQTEAPVLGCP